MNASPDATLHLDHWRIIRGRVELVISVFLLTLGAAAIFTYLSPKNYIASATVAIQTKKTGQPGAQGSSAKSTKDPNLDESQSQAVLRHDVLDPVIRQLDLQKKWSRNGGELSTESAYVKLRSMVLPEARTPDFVRISVQSISPDEAVLLVNSIARECVNQQILQHQEAVQKELEQLQDKVQTKQNGVRSLFARASRLRAAAGYADPNPESSDTSLLPKESTNSPGDEKANEIQANIADFTTQLSVVDRLMKSEDLAEETELPNLADPEIEQKLPSYQKAVVEKARLLSSGLRLNHPDVRTVQAQIDAIEEQLRQEMGHFRKRLSDQLTAAQNTLGSTETNVGINKTDQKRKNADAEYLVAKEHYDLARQELAIAQAKLSSETTESANAPEPASIHEQATMAWKTGYLSVSLTLMTGAGVGLLLGVALALVVGSLDRTIQTPQEIETRLGLTLLAVIPQPHPRVSRIDSGAPGDDPYEILKTNVEVARRKVAASVLAVVSSGARASRSPTAAKLAMAYSATEQQTLVIDAALCRPALHKLFGVDNRIGLSNYLRGERAFDQIIQNSGVPNLFVVTSGPSRGGAMELFNSWKCMELVETAKEWFDVVIFDCPQILGADGSPVICGLVEGSIIVAEHRQDPRSMVVKTKDALQNLGTKILGVALNSAYMRQWTDDLSQSIPRYPRGARQIHRSRRPEPPPIGARN